MSGRVYRRAQARDDLEAIVLYLRERSVQAADRFIDAVEEAFGLLAEMPLIGSRLEHFESEWPDLRFWTIRKFENYVVYYMPLSDGIDVVRVLHGARDVCHLLS